MSAELRLSLIGVLALLLAMTPLLFIINAWIGPTAGLYAAIGIVRSALLLTIGVLVRPWPLRVLVAAAVLVFLTLDLLAISGAWDVYNPARDESGEPIFFQF